MADQKFTWRSKTGRKRLGTRRKLPVIFTTIVFVVVLGILYLALPHAEHSLAKGGVVIVDSFYDSDPGFTDTTVAFLSSEGVKVDVFGDENVTVSSLESCQHTGTV